MIRPTWLTRSSLLRWRPLRPCVPLSIRTTPAAATASLPPSLVALPAVPRRHQHTSSSGGTQNKQHKKPPKRVSLTSFPDRVKTISTRESSKLRDALEESIPLSEKPRSFTCNQLFWTTETGGPRTIFISRKETPQSLAYLYEIAKWVQHHHPAARILLEEPNAGALEDKDDLPIYVFPPSERGELSRIVDIIICLGGDGSLLHISSTFGRGRIPPVLAFSLGTLSFLASFKAEEYPVALASVFRGGFLYTNRMRLVCRVRKPSRDSVPPEHAAMFRAIDGAYECQIPVINELTFHRGMEGQTIKIDCSVNERHITTASGDGLIVGTATGSTAYSLSCGGSMVHPAIKVIMLTPVCARSLSFRPLILPWDIHVRLTISPDSRAQRGNVHLDGFSPIPITNEDVVYVSRSPFSVPTISKQDSISDWAHDINVKLKWNQIPVPLADGTD